ncbi:AMP-binding protein [Streptomyces sudanensis]|uniref:AMP-binding protein n=1 Tax=Streptomyces sudanensis TaxID=436397 RepID=UPI0020CD2FE2|nr:AMP-binding protein [Streptomyces sudanensis]MCP9956157.1 AMP-binding protein [Streptomyces sudanensis]MCQ0003206.1 AMP-binding protein [Streptomyces sudanensis]
MSDLDGSLIRMLVDAVARHRDAVAVVDDGVAHTYAELDEVSAEIASGLAEHGIGPGDVVDVHATRSWSRCAAVLGVWRVGAGVLSIDPAMPPAWTGRLVDSAGCAMILRADECAPVEAGIAEYTFRSIRGTRRDEVATGPVCYVIPTSGSTGEPKAVAVPPVVLADLGEWHVRRWSHDRPPNTLHMSSIGFDMVYEDTVATWLAGATLIVVDDQDRLDPFTLIDIVREHDVARLFQPVVGLHGLAAAACAGGGRMPSLREISVAGEQLVINDEVRRFCADGDLTLVNQYGPSETHVVTQYRLTGDVATWPDRPPIGTAVVDAELLCHVDGRLRPFAPGETRELVIAGNCVGIGYAGDDALTAKKFREIEHRDGGTRRCYFSGDLVTFDGEEFHFVSRLDDQLKVNGYRVEPGEVEAVLTGVAGVRRAAVVGVRVAGSTQLAAFYTPVTGAEVDQDDLRGACTSHLPRFMVPRHFTELDALPSTRNGKIDRAKLRESFQELAAGRDG